MRKIVFPIIFHHDNSAGARRSEQIINKLLTKDKEIIVHTICTKPCRYNVKFGKSYLEDKFKKRHKIHRLWVPFIGNNLVLNVISFFFFAIQALPKSILLRPSITIATTAKLFTGFIGAISSKINQSEYYLDIRDTFTDNYFYFYRHQPKIIFLSIFILIENFILKNTRAVNLVSPGFFYAYNFLGDKKFKNDLILTNYTNGISRFIKIKDNIPKIIEKKGI